MMPNSRLIPALPQPQSNQRKRSNSVGIYSTHKKGFISRLLSPPHNNTIELDDKTGHHKKSIGKLFKKISGNKSDPEEQDDQENLPQVRPIRPSVRQHSKIPLAPPPTMRHRTLSQPISQQFLSDLPEQYITKRPSISQSQSHEVIRKSSGSFSIYSTFGRDSFDSVDHVSSESLDSYNTVQDHQEDTEEEDTFVDAHGFSEEDLAILEKKLQDTHLAKRLSGGHYGSAGGLVVSIQPKQIENDDELAKSMLNWKRHSDSNKRWSHILRAQHTEEGLPQTVNDKHASTVTMIDLRTTSERQEEELSMPDKLALREEAEKTLNGQPKQETLFTSDVWTSTSSISLLDDPREKNKKKEEGEDEEKARETAQMLWNEDESVVTKEKMAEWLGQNKPFHSTVLRHYMDYFNFADMRLDAAFRKLCSKLYFKAEAQQIDRILEVFANRYWECNTGCLLGSADVVYAVVYSLLLLNTDLHVAQGKHVRMTRAEFIRNTMSTILDQKEHEESLGNKWASMDGKTWEMEIENYLREMYSSVKQYQILQPLTRKTSLVKRGSILGGRRVVGLKRSVNSIIRKSGITDSMMLPDDFQPTSPVQQQQPRTSMSSGHAQSSRRESFSSINSSTTSFSSRCGSPINNMSSNSYQPMIQYMDTHASALFSSRPPYYKEGVVMRKHLLENATQKAKHREWKECYLEVDKHGELCMYQLQQQQTQESFDKSFFRHSSAAHFSLSDTLKPTVPQNPASFCAGGNNTRWATHSQLLGKIKLNHTLANALPPPGYNRQRPHVFAIQQADGGVYLFQAASAEQTQEWVSTCNYWAARTSKEPLPGGISNMEYGWGHCLDDVVMDLDAYHSDRQANNFYIHDPDSVTIHDWIPPTATMVSSQLDEKEQYKVLQKHLAELDNEINEHRDRKAKILIKFPSKCSNYSKVMSNWEARAKYLLHEIIKYQNYCDALEKSIEQLGENQLMYQTPQVDLVKEINQELHFNI
ncbi:hypothetical protein BCV71DRAFT_228517 [Rhizopus microsporus]|uniref:SEC7 domain-containing protein n=1 Tax=Rhizopus microsporus TaxID=58291 RepID=A0A1X0RUP5_RHIZD|nr:hypothetical protein BCV71DRAFT_228517 [Rhizopus microsporus]